MTISQEFTLLAHSHLAGIRFHPGMAGSFVATDLSSLTNMFENGESLWPELYRRLGDGGSADELLRVLASGLATVPQAPNDVQRALAFIRVSRGVVRLDDVIRQTGLSARQFRRRVLEESGLTPKRLCRILRFRRARELALASPTPNWAAIALDAGYFDQAHLIRDFLEFSGQTPLMSVSSNTVAG